MSRKSTTSEPRLNTSKTPKCAHISASKTKFKNRLGSSKSSPLGTYHAKFGVSSMFRLGCRWGWFENVAAHLIIGLIYNL